ncbi:MAG: VWA domain-containing protein [Candidatus Accumulibacter sp. UW20]
MSDPGHLPALLLGLFRELLAHGVPVGVRDYLDGVRALRAGFGAGSRQQLRDLALTLWARSDEERRLVGRWFDAIPVPLPLLIEDLDASLVATLPDAAGDLSRSPSGAGRAAGAPLPAAGTLPVAADAPPELAARARVAFAGSRDDSGLPVPRLAAEPSIREDYVLQPQALISPRNLAVLWRRFRRSRRSGPRSELDLRSTIDERCRRGLLQQPVYRPRRSNSARLLVLADVSPSMDPWRPFLTTLAESLQFGRLASAELRYFSNLPRRQLFAAADLTNLAGPETRLAVLRRNAGAGLLVVSDAGSARGFLNRRRALQTSAFLAEAAVFCPTIVWLNPMPETRWKGTSAALVTTGGGVHMLPLDPAHLLRAIDILRGNK